MGEWRYKRAIPTTALFVALIGGCVHKTTLPRYVPEANWGHVIDRGCVAWPNLELEVQNVPGLTIFTAAVDDDPRSFGSPNKTSRVRPLLVIGFRKSPTWFPSLLPEPPQPFSAEIPDFFLNGL